MNYKEIIKIVEDIESSVDVNTLLYDDVCAWPYVRLAIVTDLMRQTTPPANKCNYKQNIKNELKSILKMLVSHIKIQIQDRSTQILHQSDIIFLSRTSERNSLVNRKWYNPHSDSFIDTFEKDYNIINLELSDDGNMPAPAYRSPYRLDLYLFCNKFLFKLFGRFISKHIRNFHLLTRYIDKLGYSVSISEKSMSLGMARIIFRKKIFTRIFRKCQPKLFFLVCYYYETALAASLACKEHGIPVVEYQHGAQNDNNLFLTHWTKIPCDGYQLLPDYYWNWGWASARRINNWALKSVRHKAFIGGNLWISRWLNDKFMTDDYSWYNIDSIFPKPYKHIMLSTQYWSSSFPEYLLEIIQHSPGCWYWHIRQHPRHRASENEIKSLFYKLPNVKIEERSAGEVPLYLLLQHVDLHLTGYSTVAFEAAAFGIPTIFYHDNAKHGLTNIFDDRLYFFANDKKTMLFYINRLLAHRGRVNPGNNPYIVVDPETHSTCLREMLNHTF